MISYREALQNLLSKVTPIGRTETIPTLYAEGRVLAEDIISPVNVPPADNSQMDGYAVRAADLASASPEHPVTLLCRSGSPRVPSARSLKPAPLPAFSRALRCRPERIPSCSRSSLKRTRTAR